MSNLLPLLLADTLTGSAFCLCWRLLQKRLDKPGNTKMLYDFLHLTIVLFLIPLAPFLYTVIGVVGRDGSTRGILFFEQTGSMRMTMGLIGVAWLAGSVYRLTELIRGYSFRRRMERNAVLADPGLAEIDRVCRESIGIEEEARILVLDGISTSYVKGIRKPCIWLPSGEAEDNYRIMLCHEYMHIRHGDLRWNALSSLVCVLYPFMGCLGKHAGKWGELYADYEVAERGLVDEKTYGMLMYRQAVEEDQGFRGSGILGFAKRQSLTVERIERMKKRKKDNVKAGTGLKLVLAAVLATSLAVSTAGTALIARAQELWYLNTMESEEIEMAPEWMQETDLEVYEESDFAGYTVVDAEEAEDGIVPLTTKVFTCYVDPTSIYRSAGFYVEKGTVIEIYCGFTPDNVSVKLGLYTPDHTYKLRDVTRSGYVYHTAETSGTYKVAVINGNSQEVTGNGSYTY